MQREREIIKEEEKDNGKNEAAIMVKKRDLSNLHSTPHPSNNQRKLEYPIPLLTQGICSKNSLKPIYDH